MNELMTTQEAADALRVSERLVRRWRNEGKLLAVKLPGKFTRFRRADVDPPGLEVADVVRTLRPLDPAVVKMLMTIPITTCHDISPIALERLRPEHEREVNWSTVSHFFAFGCDLHHSVNLQLRLYR